MVTNALRRGKANCANECASVRLEKSPKPEMRSALLPYFILRFPELRLHGYRSSGRAEGGWDAFSKTPTAANSVICFRVELHVESEPTRHRCADSRTAKGLASPCGGRCSGWDCWRNGNGKSDRNRRILL